MQGIPYRGHPRRPFDAKNMNDGRTGVADSGPAALPPFRPYVYRFTSKFDLKEIREFGGRLTARPLDHDSRV
ncbi:hypothetical protein GCM10028790_43060 [Micromonospora taraxaci]